MVQVLVQVTGRCNIHHKEDAVCLESSRDSLQDLRRLSLVMNRIEGSYQIVFLRLVQRSRILGDEASIGQFPPLRLSLCLHDSLSGKIIAHKLAIRKRLAHQIDCMSGPTANVEDADSLL